MKNKRSMLIISAMVLLLAVVLGMGGTTFAKYITSAGSNTPSTATVAKWGWTTSVTNNLFGTGYDDTGVINTTTGYAIKSTANPAATLVGPGSKGSMTFSIAGTAEVASKVTVTFAGTDIYYDANGGELTDAYYPIKWTLKQGGSAITGYENVDLAKIVAYFGAAEKVEAGEEYSKAGSYTLEYVWNFEQSHDTEDTYLGLKANNAEYTLPTGATANTTVSVTLQITIEQIQEDVGAPS